MHNCSKVKCIEEQILFILRTNIKPNCNIFLQFYFIQEPIICTTKLLIKHQLEIYKYSNKT